MLQLNNLCCWPFSMKEEINKYYRKNLGFQMEFRNYLITLFVYIVKLLIFIWEIIFIICPRLSGLIKNSVSIEIEIEADSQQNFNRGCFNRFDYFLTGNTYLNQLFLLRSQQRKNRYRSRWRSRFVMNKTFWNNWLLLNVLPNF